MIVGCHGSLSNCIHSSKTAFPSCHVYYTEHVYHIPVVASSHCNMCSQIHVSECMMYADVCIRKWNLVSLYVCTY